MKKKDNTYEEFKNYIRDYVSQELSETEFGKTLLSVIGYCYIIIAEKRLSNFVSRPVSSGSRKVHRYGNYVRLAGSAISMATAVSEEEKKMMESGEDVDEQKKNPKKINWEKKFEFKYGAKRRTATGYANIRETASTKDAGFALFRRNMTQGNRLLHKYNFLNNNKFKR